MGIFDNLQTMAEVNAVRRATPKHELTPAIISREEKRKAKKQNGDTLRAEVWKRDQGRCRATGVQLVKSGTTDPHLLGEVDHSIPRSLAPELIYEPTNALLLSKFLNRMRKVACPEAPEHRMFDYAGPADRSLPQTFTWRDKTGAITKQRIG